MQIAAETSARLTRTPSDTERRALVLMAVAYGVLTLAVLPWADRTGPRLPQVIGVCNSGLALADFCTALLLAREFARSPRASFLVLECASLFSALMALLHAATFPGACFANASAGRRP